jgi:hypothetical protein
VLQHLVRVDHVDRVVGQVEVVDVAESELRCRGAASLRVGARRVERFGDDVDAENAAGCHRIGQVEGDRPRSAADVEQAQAGREVGKEVCGRVGRGAPLV